MRDKLFAALEASLKRGTWYSRRAAEISDSAVTILCLRDETNKYHADLCFSLIVEVSEFWYGREYRNPFILSLIEEGFDRRDKDDT